MKKLVIPFLMLLANAVPAQKFILGVEGGPELANVTNKKAIDKNASYKMRTGYNMSLFFQYNFNAYWSLKTGISYDQKGYKYKVDVPVTNQYGMPVSQLTITFNNRYDYLVLPVLFKLTLGEKMQFFANAGPYVGLLVGSSATVDQPGIVTTSPLSAYNRLNLGAALGVGLAVPVKSWQFSLEARESRGFNEVYPEWKHSVQALNVMLGIGYKL